MTWTQDTTLSFLEKSKMEQPVGQRLMKPSPHSHSSQCLKEDRPFAVSPQDLAGKVGGPILPPGRTVSPSQAEKQTWCRWSEGTGQSSSGCGCLRTPGRLERC